MFYLIIYVNVVNVRTISKKIVCTPLNRFDFQPLLEYLTRIFSIVFLRQCNPKINVKGLMFNVKKCVALTPLYFKGACYYYMVRNKQFKSTYLHLRIN